MVQTLIEDYLFCLFIMLDEFGSVKSFISLLYGVLCKMHG
jgi:hypothetical protein